MAVSASPEKESTYRLVPIFLIDSPATTKYWQDNLKK